MHAAIVPVPVFPGTANRLTLRPVGLGPPPSFWFELSQVTTAPDGSETVTPLKNGNCDMTPEQWDEWGDQVPDDAYMLGAIAHNLGLTLTA